MKKNVGSQESQQLLNLLPITTTNLVLLNYNTTNTRNSLKRPQFLYNLNGYTILILISYSLNKTQQQVLFSKFNLLINNIIKDKYLNK